MSPIYNPVDDFNPTGTPDGTLFLRDDLVWTAVPSGTATTQRTFSFFMG